MSSSSGVSDEEFEVEEILAHREEIKGEVQYWIRWKGFPESENTWEPAENLGGAEDMLRDYKIKMGMVEPERPKKPKKEGLKMKRVDKSVNQFLKHFQEGRKQKKMDLSGLDRSVFTSDASDTEEQTSRPPFPGEKQRKTANPDEPGGSGMKRKPPTTTKGEKLKKKMKLSVRVREEDSSKVSPKKTVRLWNQQSPIRPGDSDDEVPPSVGKEQRKLTLKMPSAAVKLPPMWPAMIDVSAAANNEDSDIEVMPSSTGKQPIDVASPPPVVDEDLVDNMPIADRNLAKSAASQNATAAPIVVTPDVPAVDEIPPLEEANQDDSSESSEMDDLILKMAQSNLKMISHAVTDPIPMADLPDILMPLLSANIEAKESELELLAEILADPNESVDERFAAAVKLGYLASVRQLLDAPGVDIEQSGKHNVSLLTVCSMLRCEDLHNFCLIAETLCRRGADVNRQTDTFKVTPLMVAAKQGHSCVVRRLLMAGANPNLLDSRGESALINAISKNRSVCVKNLLMGGADMHLRGTDGSNARDWADAHGENEITEALESANLRSKNSFKVALRAELAKTHQFRLVRCLSHFIYRSVSTDQPTFSCDLECLQRKVTEAEDDVFFLAIGSVEWKSADETKWKFDEMTAETEIKRVESISKVTLNGQELISLEGNPGIMRAQSWLLTGPNRVEFSVEKSQTPRFLLAIHVWRAKKTQV